MPLLLLALDDTLLDRAGAFRAWASGFLAGSGAPDYDLDWLLSVDADGHDLRAGTSPTRIRDRYGLRSPSIDLVEEIRGELMSRVRLDPLVACALRIAEDAGWVPVVVTNGETRQQEDRIRQTGLDRYVADWVISEEAGVQQAQPADLRARRPAGPDAPRRRLGGRRQPRGRHRRRGRVGLPSVWLHRGRELVDDRFAPTRIVGDVIAAVARSWPRSAQVMAAR